jgi:lipopolysaccharide transport system permease protein
MKNLLMSRLNEATNSMLGIVTSLTNNYQLVSQMAWREIVSKYKGSMLGTLWSVVTPILMLAVYTVVFSVIFKTRWQGGTGSKTEFAILIFTGLIVFNFFAEVINRAPRLILDNPNYVKKTVFPLEALPWVALFVALFNAAISLIVLLIFSIIINGGLPWTIILLPLIVLPLILFVVGISWFLASLGVFLRDISQAIGILTSVLMFLSPIFYPTDALPEQMKALGYLNPLAFYIENMRNFLIWGRLDNMHLYPYHLGASLIFAFLGLAWFRRTRHAFADVM